MFVCYSVQEPVRGELWFAANISSPGANWFAVANFMPVSKKLLANAFAKFYVRREPSSRRTRSRRTLVRSGCNFFPRTYFLANRSPVRGGVRANSGELGRTPANVRRTPANVRRSSAECRCWRTDGEFARSSREFARVRPSSREFAANDSSPGILP